VLIFASVLHSAPQLGGEMKFSGLWYMTPNKWQYARDNYQLFDLTMSDDPADNISYKARVQTRLFRGGTVSSLSDLSDFKAVSAYEIIPWEIWVKINDIPFKNLSIKAGKQYFEWGTADGIHPGSALNPDDYTNPFAMGDKIPVTALDLNYTFNSVKFDLVWVPVFTPVKMPKYFPMFDNSAYQMPGFEIVSTTEALTLPKQKAGGMGMAANLAFSLFNIDFSVGAFDGYDYLPKLKQLTYDTTSAGVAKLALDADFDFPKLRLYSFNAASDIAGIGYWLEAGVYDYNNAASLSSSPFGVQSTTVFDGKPYISYVAGGDYNFQNGLYINLQYACGLPYVRGKGNMEDYLMLSVKQDFFYGLLDVELANMFGARRKYALKDNYEIILMQKLSYNATDNLVFSLFVSEIGAKGNTLFNAWKDYDSLGTELSYAF